MENKGRRGPMRGMNTFRAERIVIHKLLLRAL